MRPRRVAHRASNATCSLLPNGLSVKQVSVLRMPHSVGLFSFIDIHFIKLTVSKGFDAYSFILSAIRVMP